MYVPRGGGIVDKDCVLDLYRLMSGARGPKVMDSLLDERWGILSIVRQEEAKVTSSLVGVWETERFILEHVL